MAFIHFKNYEKRRLKVMAGYCRAGTNLDLGFAQSPNPFLDANRTTGVDLNENLTEVHYGRELIGDVTDLKAVIQNERFDNVLVGELIEHLESPYDFLRSLRQVISPKGKIILSTPNPCAWPTLFFEYSMSRRFFYTNEHKYYIPPRWMLRILEHTGFKIIATRGVGLWLPVLTLPCPAVMSYQVIYAAEPAITSSTSSDLSGSNSSHGRPMQ